MLLRSTMTTCLALALLTACGQGQSPDAASTSPDGSARDGADAETGAPAGTAEAGADGSAEAGDPGDAVPGPVEFPSLAVATLDGGHYDLADRRGRWVVVNFWATWCAPCLKEMPELSALDTMREHIEVVGLAYEDTDPDTLRAFLEQRPVSYPVAIVDTYDPPRDFPTPRGLPLTCLVAPDGRLVQTFLGPVTALELEQAIEAAGGPVPGQPAAPPPSPLS